MQSKISIIGVILAVLNADAVLAGTSKPPPQNAPKIKTEGLISPIGAVGYNEIYSFIREYILDCNKDEYYTKDLQRLVKDELEIELQNRKNTEYKMKPLTACVAEGEYACLLSDLCQANSWCSEITLFTKNGVSFASSGGCRHPTFKEDKDDVYEHLGFLYPDPSKYVKIKKLTRIGDNATYFRITKAIYFNKANGGMYFLSKNDPQDEIVGYISYIVHPVYFEIGDGDYDKLMAKYGLK